MSFFNELNPIRKFLDFTESDFYQTAPVDWLVVVTDVEGSTQAIEDGKYKWVNMAGASTIVAIANALGTHDFPFVFGGDGASAIIPRERRAQIEAYLRTAKRSAFDTFRLNLRIGMIPHEDLIAAQAPVQIARYSMNHGPHVAFFKGEGLALAEKWVKNGRGLIQEGAMEEAGKVLKGLSCRWAPIKSTQGMMLSILIKPRKKGEKGEETLAKTVREINRIVDLDSPKTQPLKLSTFKSEAFFKAARAEAKLLSISPFFLAFSRVIFEMLAFHFLDFLGIKIGHLNIRKYKASMITHSDFRKYDETLRLVIDCTTEMRHQIFDFLKREHNQGELFFGMHESDSALLTCFLESMEEGQHIHFVDGSDGGYALAAKEMKRQISEAF